MNRRRNSFIIRLLDNGGIETHDNEQSIIEEDHNFSNINNNNNHNNNSNNNRGQIYEGLGEMPNNNISSFENEGPNLLFDTYIQEINTEENELERDLSEIF